MRIRKAAQAWYSRKPATAQVIDVAKLCFESDKETLSRTENSQIAIFTHSMAALGRSAREAGAAFKAAAGFSLGEYTSLAAAGVVTLADGVKIVSKRGKLMQHAADTIDGGMAAILGLEDAKIEEACAAGQERHCPSGQLQLPGSARYRRRKGGARRGDRKLQGSRCAACASARCFRRVPHAAHGRGGSRASCFCLRTSPSPRRLWISTPIWTVKVYDCSNLPAAS